MAAPAVSTGAFGFPFEEAARIAVRTVVEAAPTLRSVRDVRFVLFDDRATERFTQVLRSFASA